MVPTKKIGQPYNLSLNPHPDKQQKKASDAFLLGG
jgi:hypothetical protein